MQPPKYDPRCDAERPRLRGVPESRFEVGAFAALPHLRTCWLWRRLAESTRHQAFSCDRPSDHRRIRSAGRVEMVLCRRGFFDFSDRTTPRRGAIPRRPMVPGGAWPHAGSPPKGWGNSSVPGRPARQGAAPEAERQILVAQVTLAPDETASASCRRGQIDCSGAIESSSAMARSIPRPPR